MPKVGNTKYSYSAKGRATYGYHAKGRAAAKRAAKRRGKKVVYRKKK